MRTQYLRSLGPMLVILLSLLVMPAQSQAPRDAVASKDQVANEIRQLDDKLRELGAALKDAQGLQREQLMAKIAALRLERRKLLEKAEAPTRLPLRPAPPAPAADSGSSSWTNPTVLAAIISAVAAVAVALIGIFRKK